MKNYLIILFNVILFNSLLYTQGAWIKVGDMPDRRYAQTVNAINNKVYVVGGMHTESDTIPESGWIYDRVDSTWSNFSHNGARVMHSSCVVGTKLYIIGGYQSYDSTSATINMYDPATNTWSSMMNMPTHRANLTCATIDGKIYAIGGMFKVAGQPYNGTGLKVVEMYDTLNNNWTSMQDMPTGRWGSSAIVANGKIYVIGGRSTTLSVAYDIVEIYDPVTNNWSSGINMITARYQMTTCFLNDKLYAIGGWRHSNNGPIYNNVEAFDPNLNVWITETPMPVRHAVLSSCTHNGKIYTYGGSNTTHPLTGTTEIYEYTPVTGIEDNLFRVSDEFNISQNYPNPFNPATTIEFDLPKTSEVSLKVFNILGEEVATLVSDGLSAGSYSYEWDASNLASGVYLYRLQAGDPSQNTGQSPSQSAGQGYVETRKMILMR